MDDAGPAYLMLAHAGLDRAGALARHLAGSGAPVAVHLDARADGAAFARALAPGRVIAVPRRRSDWGGFGLVAASLDGLQALMASGQAFSHVALVSGADLPLRAPSDLHGFLTAHPGADFIETVDPQHDPWVRGGLSQERFDWVFPVSWRKRPRLFDTLCGAQRRLGVVRRRPDLTPPLVPRLGAQWWCLSRGTVAAMLASPDLPALVRWFRLSWLPDESFFATLQPRVTDRPPDPRGTLTYARFDPKGRPYVFYDDHRAALAASDYFFARKVWPGAAALIGAFPAAPAGADFTARPPAIDFGALESRAAAAPPGLRHPGRAPLLRAERLGATPRPYRALAGLDRLYGPAIMGWIGARADIALHGRVFAKGGPLAGRFASGDVGPGGVTAPRGMPPAAQERLLANLIAAGTAQVQGVLLDPGDGPIVSVIADDPMATVLIVRDAWALAQALPPPEAARRAIAAERDLLHRLGPGRAVVLEAAALLGPDPGAALRAALGAARIGLPRDDGVPPPATIVPPDTLRARLAGLRAQGLDVSPLGGP
jgi:hypothetical protein